MSHRLQQQILTFLQDHLPAGSTLLLAYSGGLDSSVLLHLLCSARENYSFNLRALHVHHGLSTNADSWAEFCAQVCQQLSVPFKLTRLTLNKHSGKGIEATAREGRYAALFAEQADYIALAHHQDDQAETVLLQLLRGAGSKGLSAMAAHDAGRRLLRPLLDISRAELEAYAREHQLKWVDDESNEDTIYDRNYLRHQVIPVIEKRFAAARTTLSRSAQLLAESAQLLDELAAIDAGEHFQQLEISHLAKLGEARARNLLRWWLATQHLSVPSAARLQEMLQQLLSAKPDASLKVMIDGSKHLWLRRYQGLAYIDAEPEEAINTCWQGEAVIDLPDGSQLHFEPCKGQGLALQRLAINKLRISSRQGGERFKPDEARPTRTLKHLMQEAGIPPWLRQRMPLIYSGDELAVVPMLGIACHMQARPGEVGLLIIWKQKP